MRTALPRYCLASCLAFALPASAALTYKVKAASADMFRTEALEPPPVANLAEGEVLKMIHRGAASSLLETEGGIKGWMRNSDLLAMQAAKDRRHELENQEINPDKVFSPLIPGKRFGIDAEIAPERDFDADILEPKDREEVEMRHDEN